MITPAPGILLIADPFLKDPNFMRTVVFICEHQQEGSMGFVLNRQFEQTMDYCFCVGVVVALQMVEKCDPNNL